MNHKKKTFSTQKSNDIAEKWKLIHFFIWLETWIHLWHLLFDSLHRTIQQHKSAEETTVLCCV